MKIKLSKALRKKQPTNFVKAQIQTQIIPGGVKKDVNRDLYLLRYTASSVHLP